jgi:hypothetical protein
MIKVLSYLVVASLLGPCLAADAPKEPAPAAPAPAATAGIDTEAFCQHWMRSTEEEKQGEHIYRPKASRQFPPSRFRMQFVFKKNGDCQYLYLSPEDAHRMKDAQWRIDGGGTTLLIIKGDATESYKIVEVSKEILRLKPNAS